MQMGKRIANNGAVKIIGITVTMIALATAFAMGYGGLTQRVDSVETEHERVRGLADANRECVIKLEMNMRHLLTGQQEQKALIQNQHKLLEEIRRDIRSGP
jgi:hypothetical protein